MLHLTSPTNPGQAAWDTFIPANVIPAGGTISGTYEGPTLCEGNVTVTGPLVVIGDLFVVGTFSNGGGYQVTVRGDMFAGGNMNMDRTDTTLSQSQFLVSGSLYARGNVVFRQSGAVAAPFIVLGDFVAQEYSGGLINKIFQAEAVANATCPGCSLLVGGDANLGSIAVYGASNAAGPGSNGGSVTVYGNLVLSSTLSAYGGAASVGGGAGGAGGNVSVTGNAASSAIFNYGGAGNGGAGGNGGTVFVGGCLTSPVQNFGGTGTNGNGGNGGSISISGPAIGSFVSSGGAGSQGNGGAGGACTFRSTLSCSGFDSNGGNCASTADTHFSGSAGSLSVSGSMDLQSGNISMVGGLRSGAVATAGTILTSPNGGTLSLYSSFSARQTASITLDGGSVTTTGNSPHPAGNGGSIIAVGPVQMAASTSGAIISANGGNVTGSQLPALTLLPTTSGLGGTFRFYSSVSYVDGTPGKNANFVINLIGGTSRSAGSLTVGGDFNWTTINAYGGDALVGSGGNGGSLIFQQNAILGSISSAFTTPAINAYGGFCTSSTATDAAGAGGTGASPSGAALVVAGNLRLLSSTNGSVINLYGGNRSGGTTLAASNTAPSGGNIDVGGDLVADTITLNSGNITTTFSNGVGGNGGNLTVRGTSLVTISITSNGGTAAGRNAGNGGTLTFNNSLSMVRTFNNSVGTITVNGGSSNGSADFAPQTYGGCGNVNISAGAIVGLVNLSDGFGGAASTYLGGMKLSGFCSFNQINQSGRGEVRIQTNANGLAYCLLRVSQMLNKPQLWNTGGGFTGALPTSVYLAYSTNLGGPTWFYLPGINPF